MNKPARLYYLDWTRVLVIGGVFVVHALMPFSALPWLINSDQKLFGTTPILLAANQFGMPLLFMVSGAATWFSLRRRSGTQFAAERFKRLVIPYLVLTVLLSPIQAYYQALQHGTYQGGLIEFLPRFFNLGGFTSFDLRWAGYYGYHLWFVIFLFFFSIVSLPLFLYIKGGRGRWLLDAMARVCRWPGGVLLLAAPIALSQVLLRATQGAYQGWADTAFWGFFYGYGYLFLSEKPLDEALDNHWKSGLAGFLVSLALLVVIGLMTLIGLEKVVSLTNAGDTLANPAAALEGSGLASAAGLVYIAVFSLLSLNSWSAVVFLMSVMKKRANVTNRALVYLGDIAMPVYLFHHPVIVVLGYYLVQLPIPAWAQFVLLLASAALITWGIVEVLIRRIPFLRRMIGMRSQPERL